jgi:hypothetical protein
MCEVFIFITTFRIILYKWHRQRFLNVTFIAVMMGIRGQSYRMDMPTLFLYSTSVEIQSQIPECNSTFPPPSHIRWCALVAHTITIRKGRSSEIK